MTKSQLNWWFSCYRGGC